MNETSQPVSTLPHRERLAEVLRGLCAEIVACDAPDVLFLQAAEEAEAFLRRLEREPRRVRLIARDIREEMRPIGKKIHYGDMIHFSPLSGSANPLAPPMTLWKENEETLKGLVRFSAAYEGGPGMVHGGCIAAAFDELLGLTQSLTGKAGMTGTLRIRYRNPCPLHTELRMEGRVDQEEERKISTRGTLHAGDLLVADATATFILIDPERYREKMAAHLGGPGKKASD
jgi:acyl-coenzyme A thioesterase PaaI-like protein